MTHRRNLTTTRVGSLCVVHDGDGYAECSTPLIEALALIESELVRARNLVADLENARRVLVAHYDREMDPWRET